MQIGRDVRLSVVYYFSFRRFWGLFLTLPLCAMSVKFTVQFVSFFLFPVLRFACFCNYILHKTDGF